MDMGAQEQAAAEQAVVTTMFRRLDAEAAEILAELGAAQAAERAVLLRRRLAELRDAETGLVFGRIDHADGGSLYIGRRGIRVDGEPLLVDWRAPAATPFYAATAARPMGLRRRRHLRLDGRTVQGLSDEILDGSPPAAADVPGDGPLAAALAAPRTGRMRAAVDTLQAEQDAVVRSPARGVLVVQGGPGTGKTVVALHRAAYVIFAFAARGVLVVGPDARFLDYISQVLPSLGEHDVRLTTRTAIAGRDQGEAEPVDVARLKGRAELAEGLAAWIRARLPVPATVTLPAGVDRIELDAETVAEVLDAARHLPYRRGRAAFREGLVAALARAWAGRVRDELAGIDAQAAAATGLDLDEVVSADLRALGFDGAPSGTAPPPDLAALRATLDADPRLGEAIGRLWPPLTPAGVVAGLLAAPTVHLPAAFAALRGTAATPALLDEAAALLGETPDAVYGHVVVDEAQELTEMDWRAVMRRCPGRSMTLVGDFAQAGPASTVRDWWQALRPYAGNRFAVHTLSVNYRTTAEILGFSRGLLAVIAPEQGLSLSLRHGQPPRVRAVPRERLTAAVAEELRGAPAGPTAVICADAAAAGLAEAAAETGAQVVEASAARGLEFDVVLVVDPELIVRARPSGHRDLYVALTRATRHLVVLPTDATWRCL